MEKQRFILIIVAILFFGGAMSILKATSCQRDGTHVAIEGTWTWNSQQEVWWCIGSVTNCRIDAMSADVPDNQAVMLKGHLSVQPGPFYYFDATDQALSQKDSVWTCCGKCE
jgi:hypothetical protein